MSFGPYGPFGPRGGGPATGLAALLFAAACGPATDDAEAPRETVLLLTVDEVRADHLGTYGGPRSTADTLDRLGARAVVFEDAITPSTETLSALAALFGGGPVDAGIPGRHRIRRSVHTLAERWSEAGAATLAAVPLRALTGRLTGLDQGFESYLDTDLPESGRALRAGELVERLLPPLREALAGDRDLFLWVHFADAADDPRTLHPRELELVRARLAGAAEGLEIDEATATALTEGDARELLAAVARRRGSRLWSELREALHDVQIARIDAAVARLVSELEAAGRADARIALVGTRGRYLTEDRPDGPAEGFSEGLVRVPFFVALPEELAEFRNRLREPTSSKLAALYLAPESALPSTDTGPLVVRGPGGTTAHVFGEYKAIRSPDGAVHWVAREDDAPADAPERLEDLRARALRPALELSVESAAPERAWSLTLRTRAPSLLGVQEEDGGIRPATRGGRELVLDGSVPSGPRTFAVHATRDDLGFALELGLDGRRPDASEVAFGGLGSVLDVPIPVLLEAGPTGEREPWSVEDGEPWIDVAPLDGGWQALTVTAECGAPRARLWLVRFPPVEEPEPLEWRSGARVETLSDPALPGALVLAGEVPLRVEVRPGTRAGLALHARAGDRGVPPERIRHEGQRLDGRSLALYFPPFLPERLDWFTGEPVRGSTAAAVRATLSLDLRRDAGYVDGPIDLAPDEVRFLRAATRRP